MLGIAIVAGIESFDFGREYRMFDGSFCELVEMRGKWEKRRKGRDEETAQTSCCKM